MTGTGLRVSGRASTLSNVNKWLRFAKWLWSTPWPVYALTTLQSHLIGAVFVFAFLRFGLPLDTFLDIGPFQLVNQYLFIGTLVLGLLAGAVISTWLIIPVLRAMRSSEPFDRQARHRTLNMPAYQAWLQGAIWVLGTTVFVAVNFSVSHRLALIMGVTAVLGGLVTCIISYLQSERLMRPIMRRALGAGVPVDSHLPGVRRRIILGWVLTTAVPSLGIVLVVIAYHFDQLGDDPRVVIRAIGMLAIAALVTGVFGMQLVSTSVADPVRDLQSAVKRVQQGDFSARTAVYDATEMGALQVGFNEMVADLEERETMQDLFGRYVGEDVVLHALENGTELGGSERTVGVLFVDLAGSTEFAAINEPARVVKVLNDFFRIVVDTVDEHGGYINKFQGDAALAIFGAPMEAWDPAGQALATARALGRKMESIHPLTAGIGISYGTVIAGHIGHAKRFEYTVIGDPVNEASRLTSLAKLEQGGVLAARRAVEAADPEEADRWTFGRAVELRGRGAMTQLARPLRPTLADRWQAAHDLGLEELPTVTEPTLRESLLDDDEEEVDAAIDADAAHIPNEELPGRSPAENPGRESR